LTYLLSYPHFLRRLLQLLTTTLTKAVYYLRVSRLSVLAATLGGKACLASGLSAR
jgi:hypothetical protein